MIRVGITGQNGFIGQHLFNSLALEETIERVPFSREYFELPEKLCEFVRSCDVIVHLAALNRHGDMQILHNRNVGLVQKLVTAMETSDVTPHVIFSSSSQEGQDNLYGASKKQGRRIFQDWAVRCGAQFTGMIIPNVFGPFGRPDYNSVVATFCHRLTHGDHPKILVDNSLKLIYVDDLCKDIIRIIRGTIKQNPYHVPYCAKKKVSKILSLLNYYKNTYFDHQVIPEMRSYFENCLFNTFVCHIDHPTFFPGKLHPHVDNRGRFVELLKLDCIGGQVSFSTTRPQITRGDHYHTRKFERFVVIKGQARIQLRRIGTEQVIEFVIDANNCPGFVDIPVWYTHNITNIGHEELYTIFWINEFYDPLDTDTFFAKVCSYDSGKVQ
jgi:UDP-2-acetamido-2,6-beta-L-arabino-hexul-4-ose reductase